MPTYNVSARVVLLIEAADEADARRKTRVLVDSINGDAEDADAFESEPL